VHEHLLIRRPPLSCSALAPSVKRNYRFKVGWWNLFPSHPTINAVKHDRLPNDDAMVDAQDLISNWWERAWLHRSADRFFSEAMSALSAIEQENTPNKLSSVFEAMLVPRSILKRDQQFEEWTCC